MGRLYCGDSNGHVHFESFSSHISLTLRTPVLFIFRRVTRIGHGMKYILRSLDKCPGKRREAAKLLFINAGERKGAGRESLGLSGADVVLTANAERGPNFNRSQVHRLRGDEL